MAGKNDLSCESSGFCGRVGKSSLLCSQSMVSVAASGDGQTVGKYEVDRAKRSLLPGLMRCPHSFSRRHIS